MDYYNLAIQRESTRSFKKKPVSDKQLVELLSYFSDCKRLRPAIRTEIKILDSEACKALTDCAGYYNFMIEAPHYILILSDTSDYYLENAGYMGEDLVLKMTELELDTCWITIKNSAELKKQLGIQVDLEPAALIAFGNATKQFLSSRLDIKSPSDITIKKRTGFVAPKLEIDHAVFESEWGTQSHISTLPINSSLYQAFIAACCSPSFLNRQPYRFILDGHTVVLVALEDEMTDFNDAKLNLGIVMLHFSAVMGVKNNYESGWILGKPEKGYIIPKNGTIAAYYQS